MRGKPNISVVIPVYNVRDYLDECMAGVLSQDYMNYEIILVDDGSTDGSENICDKYAAEYECVKTYHKPNGGLASARNFGVDHSSGKYIIFLDSDDYWCCSSALSTLFIAASSSGADIVRGDYKEVDLRGNEFSHKKACKSMRYAKKLLTNREYLQKIAKGENFAWLSLYSREIFNKARMNESLRFFEDIDFAARLYVHPLKCMYVPLLFYAYRQRPGSLVNMQDDRKLGDSFNACAVFGSCAEAISDRGLRHYYHRMRVMMYYWTLQTLATDPFYENRHHIIDKYNLSELRKDVNSWFWEDCLSGFSLVFFMSPAAGTVYLRKRTGVTLPIRKAMSKLRKIFSAG